MRGGPSSVSRNVRVKPVVLTIMEADVLIDLARDRMATMVKVDGEDILTNVAICGAVRKLEEARRG